MFFKFGSYQHDDAEVNLTRMNIRYRLSPRGRRLSRIVTLFLKGEFCEDGQAAVNAKVNELIDAYSSDYKDARLYLDDGTPTRHGLTNDSPDCISGVRVLQRSWPQGGGDTFATTHRYSITLEAEYADVESQLVSWQESLRFIGNCGPRYDIVETYLGPFPVLTAQRTVQRIIQTGQAVGYQAFIEPPGSLFPDIEHQHLRDIDLESGKSQGRLSCYFPSRWTYHHSSGISRAGVPNTR